MISPLWQCFKKELKLYEGSTTKIELEIFIGCTLVRLLNEKVISIEKEKEIRKYLELT